MTAFYYPLVSYVGYFLSEAPYALFVSASALYTLRLADTGRMRHAWLLGVMLAFGVLFRTQILIVLPFLMGFALWRRRSFPLLRIRHALPVFVCIALAQGLLALWIHRHAGEWSMSPTNRALNRVFGRCHPSEVHGEGMFYSPEVITRLHHWSTKHPDRLLQLNPARELIIRVKQPLWIEAPLDDIADDCVRRTGITGQLGYAAAHAALLWADTAWPDGGQRGYGKLMRWAGRVHFGLFFFPMLAAMLLGLSGHDARRGLVALYLWSMIAVAMLFFGSARIRTVHDGIIIALAIDAYGRLTAWLAQRLAARKARRAQSCATPTAPA
jgi:hypothetical protein